MIDARKPKAKEAEPGIMSGLEVFRLMAHSVQTLENAGELIDELLSYQGLVPDMLRARITDFRDDLVLAAERKGKM